MNHLHLGILHLLEHQYQISQFRLDFHLHEMIQVLLLFLLHKFQLFLKFRHHGSIQFHH